MANEFADELDVLDRGDAAGDAEDYLPSLQLLALGAADALTGVHAGEAQTGGIAEGRQNRDIEAIKPRAKPIAEKRTEGRVPSASKRFSMGLGLSV